MLLFDWSRSHHNLDTHEATDSPCELANKLPKVPAPSRIFLNPLRHHPWSYCPLQCFAERGAGLMGKRKEHREKKSGDASGDQRHHTVILDSRPGLMGKRREHCEKKSGDASNQRASNDVSGHDAGGGRCLR